jgi:hypothetical protein
VRVKVVPAFTLEGTLMVTGPEMEAVAVILMMVPSLSSPPWAAVP